MKTFAGKDVSQFLDQITKKPGITRLYYRRCYGKERSK